MELKKGYQNTDIGEIPEEWEITDINSISIDMLQGVNTAIAIPEYVEDGIPMLKANNIIDGVVNFSTSDHVSIKTYSSYSDRFKLKKWDFLFSNIGARLGTGSLLNKDIESTFAWNVMRIIPNPKLIYPTFLGHIMNSKIINLQILNNISGSGMGFVPKNVLKGIKLPLPTKIEQIAIANALSDADAYITSLEKLIDKKCQIKQGAMQELMNPKDGWEIKKLGEFNFDISDGNYSSKYPNSSEFKTIGIPFIRANNIRKMSISDNDMRFISPELHSELKKGHLKKNDILLTTRGEIGQLALVPDSHIDSNINAQIVRINTEEKIDTKFLAYFFTKNETQNEFMNAQTGSALKQLPINKLKEIQIIYPSLSTQKNISQILYDIDKDLFQLESNLEKAKSMKQGMMQNLLTGKIRLL